MTEMRLQKFLSRAGVCSRRKGEEYIKAGRPFVDSDLKLMMITSWNEWHEDTQIEPLNIASPTNKEIKYTNN